MPVSIETTLLIPLGLAGVLLVWLTLCGTALVSRWFAVPSLLARAAAGFSLATALFMVLANLVGKFTTVPVAFGTAVVLISLAGIESLLALRHAWWRRPTLSTVVRWGVGLLVASLLFYGSLAVRLQAYFYDFPTHLGFAATIARDNLPVHNPYAPRLPSYYHYGAALLVAALQRATGLPIEVGYELLAATQGTALLVLVMALGAAAGRHAGWGMVSLLGFFGAGSLVVWWPGPETWAVVRNALLQPLSLESWLAFPDFRRFVEQVYPIFSFSSDWLWLLVYPHRLVGLLTLVTLAVLMTSAREGSRRPGAVTLAALLAAAIALCDEVMFPLALVLLAWPVLSARRDMRQRWPWATSLGVGLLLAATQGGVLTDMLWAKAAAGPHLLLRTPVEVAQSLVFVQRLEAGWLWVLPPLPLLAAGGVLAWRRCWVGLVLCLCALAAYAGYHSVTYPYAANDLARVVNVAFLLMGIVLPLAVASALRGCPRWGTTLVAVFLMPVAVPSLAYPLANLIPQVRAGVELRDPYASEARSERRFTDPEVRRNQIDRHHLYSEIAQLLPPRSAVLSDDPITFTIVTGVRSAFAPPDVVMHFPTHHYLPAYEYFDAFWRLDPEAWRRLGATAVLYHTQVYRSLPTYAKELLHDTRFFTQRYAKGDLLLFQATAEFLAQPPARAGTLRALAAELPLGSSVFVSPELAYGIGQSLLRLLKDYPTAGLDLDPAVLIWMQLSRPSDLTRETAEWWVLDDSEARWLGLAPESARWRFSAPGLSAGVYPNGAMPAFPLHPLPEGERLSFQAVSLFARTEGGIAHETSIPYTAFKLLLAGRPGTVVEVCAATTCQRLALKGLVWSLTLPLSSASQAIEVRSTAGTVFVSGSLGYGSKVEASVATGLVIQPRIVDGAVEVDAEYFNSEGWRAGGGVAWQLFRSLQGEEQHMRWWPSQILMVGDGGTVRLRIAPDGKATEHNFTIPAQPLPAEALPDGEYALYLTFAFAPGWVVDRVPTARFTVQEGKVADLVVPPQIVRLSFYNP